MKLQNLLFAVALVNNPAISLSPSERLISIVASNDIHGGIEATRDASGDAVGGLDYWAGVVHALRQGIPAHYGATTSGVLVVDGGDQFQGTLISNFNEGKLVLRAMSAVGYDAAITGNHDYDFGPIGWLQDQVVPGWPDQRPRGALEDALKLTAFPWLSANTYLKASLGVPVSPSRCKFTGTGPAPSIDWSQATRPSFLVPSMIKIVAGVRVAIIGIDNAETPTTTTPANVSDYCFDDEAQAYLRERHALEGQADVFVLIIHDGDTDTDFGMSDLVRGLPAGSVDAVVSAHTHFVTNTRIGGVPIIQSGANGLKFGRIDLVYDTASRALEPDKTRSYGGLDLLRERCAPAARDFCTENAGVVSFEGVEARPVAEIATMLAEGHAAVAALAEQRLGTASAPIKSDRIGESALADSLTDAFLGLAPGAEVAFLNTGGLRAPILPPFGWDGAAPFSFTYEDLFRVLPFNNHGLVIGPMAPDKLVRLLARSVKTCGSFGALMQSGLRVTFARDCTHAVHELDPQARLLTVSTLNGEAIFDASRGGLLAPAGRSFQVATLDFLAAGGSGFDDFAGVPVVLDAGILRESLKAYYAEHPATLSPATDGRWVEQKPL